MAQSAPAPRRIGKFEILDRLGQGGMGTVYKARDPGLDRLVALKPSVGDAVSSEEARERFYREARAAARLQHPNIVTVFEAGDVDGTLFIAMVHAPFRGDAPAGYLENLHEAESRLAAHDLERALEASRRAQAVEPSGRAVVKLLQGIEARLASAGVAPTHSPTAVVTQLRTSGAVVYRDVGTFGEPPATQTMAFSPVLGSLRPSRPWPTRMKEGAWSRPTPIAPCGC